jgi:hypothetical protein
MSMHFRDIAVQAASDGAIGPEEILALRRAGWVDGRMDPEEAEALFVANDHIAEPSAEWCDFFVEALGEFIVNTVEPKGYVDQVMADELVSRIDRDGRVETMAELELLVRVLERSQSVPGSLRTYALRQIEDAVLHGEGATRRGELDPKGINETECTLLRRLIFSAGGDRPAAVSKAEAEMLFRIKDATLYELNAPDWDKLFVQGVANYLIGFGGHEPLTRDRAAELEQFLAAEGAGISAFLGRMAMAEPDFKGAFGSLLDMGPQGLDTEGAAAEAAAFTEQEDLWLLDRIDADEELDPLEKALLAFIAEETGDAPAL